MRISTPATLSLPSFAQTALLLLAIALLTGCTHLREEQTPAGWPTVWEHRTLTRADTAWIYASSKPLAEEAASTAADAASTYRALVHRDPPVILLIVTDTQESLPPMSRTPEELLKSASTSRGPPRDEPNEMSPKQRAVVQHTLADLYRCAPIPLTDDQLSLLTTLPEPIAKPRIPVVLLPSRASIESASNKLFDEAAAASDMTFAARLLVAPMFAWARSRMVDELVETQRDAILEAQAAAGGLTPADRAAIDHYLRDRMAAMEKQVQPPAPK